MYTQSQPKTQSNSKKFVVGCLLAGIACSTVGLIASNMTESSPAAANEFEELVNYSTMHNIPSSERHTSRSHGGSTRHSSKTPKVTHTAMEEINMIATKDLVHTKKTYKHVVKAESDIKRFADDDFNFSDSVGPAITHTIKALRDNVHWGAIVTDKLVNVDKIQKSFNDSKDLNSELHSLFPKSYKILAKLNQQKKLLSFDLANAISDVGLLAESTKENLSRSTRKIALREKYLKLGKLSDRIDEKIWGYVLKTGASDLKYSEEKTDAVLKTLEKIELESIKTKHALNLELKDIKRQIEHKMRSKQMSIESVESDISDSHCGFWDAVFTFGLSCVRADKARGEMTVFKNQFKRELRVAEALFNKLEYFNDFTKPTKKEKETEEQIPLTPVPKPSTKPHPKPTTKPVPKCDESKDPLCGWSAPTQETGYDYDHFKIPDSGQWNDPNPWTFLDAQDSGKLGDSVVVNEFAVTYIKQSKALDGYCEKVMTHTGATKAKLQKALIWNK